jgi:hypothetical protein
MTAPLPAADSSRNLSWSEQLAMMSKMFGIFTVVIYFLISLLVFPQRRCFRIVPHSAYSLSLPQYLFLSIDHVLVGGEFLYRWLQGFSAGNSTVLFLYPLPVSARWK